jgi:hypothetical protein
MRTGTTHALVDWAHWPQQQQHCDSRSNPARPPLATASISSMNTMAGASLRADANSSRTLMAPMPTYSSTNSEAEMEKKGTLASPAAGG